MCERGVEIHVLRFKIIYIYFRKLDNIKKSYSLYITSRKNLHLYSIRMMVELKGVSFLVPCSTRIAKAVRWNECVSLFCSSIYIKKYFSTRYWN